jgi:hypothetical protein
LRAALVAALDEAREAKAEVARQKAGIERTEAAMREAEASVETAQKGVEKAKQADARALAHAAAHETKAPKNTMRAARQAVTDAEDRRDALRAARDRLEADWERDLGQAEVAVEAAISAILAPVAVRLIKRGEEIEAQLTPIKRVLSALWYQADRPSQYGAGAAFDTGRAPLEETRAAAGDWLQSINEYDVAVPDPFLIARAKLRADPTSELPTELTGLLGP